MTGLRRMVSHPFGYSVELTCLNPCIWLILVFSFSWNFYCFCLQCLSRPMFIALLFSLLLFPSSQTLSNIADHIAFVFCLSCFYLFGSSYWLKNMYPVVKGNILLFYNLSTPHLSRLNTPQPLVILPIVCQDNLVLVQIFIQNVFFGIILCPMFSSSMYLRTLPSPMLLF